MPPGFYCVFVQIGCPESNAYQPARFSTIDRGRELRFERRYVDGTARLTIDLDRALVRLFAARFFLARFGADLGAEKFVDIKCRKAGLKPDACVIVATIRALKYHGGVDLKQLNNEDLAALERGIANLARHVDNVRNRYGLPCVVSINHFTHDTEAEVALLKSKIAAQDTPVVVAKHWALGGAGAEELARTVAAIADKGAPLAR